LHGTFVALFGAAMESMSLTMASSFCCKMPTTEIAPVDRPGAPKVGHLIGHRLVPRLKCKFRRDTTGEALMTAKSC
jgi:hypothetical protein